MSRKEKIKFALELSKSLMMAFLTGLFGVLAYVVVNIHTISLLQLLISLGGILAIIVFFYFLVKYIIKKLKELEKLE